MKTKQLAFIGLMSGINIVLFTIGLFFPAFYLLILISIPFNAAFTYTRVNKKYVLIYFLATLLITLLINFQEGLFTILPTMISGIVFGYCIEKKIHGFLLISINALISTILQLVSIVLIYFIYKINMNSVFAGIFNIEIDYFNEISLIFYFSISLIQLIITYFIIESEIKKLKLSIKESHTIYFPTLIITLLTSIIGFVLYYFSKSFSFLLTGISLFYSVYLLDYLLHYNSKYFRYIIIAIYTIMVFVCLFLSSSTFAYDYSLNFNIFSITTSLIGGILILDSICLKKQKITSEIFNKLIEDEETNL